MNTERGMENNKISRRAFLRRAVGLAAVGLPVLSGADLGYRHVILSFRDIGRERERDEIIENRVQNELHERAERIYPQIPGLKLPGSRVFTPPDELKSRYPDPVVIGYDGSGKPVELSILEGDELVEALERWGGYSQESLDAPQMPSHEFKNRDGTAGPTKPDGTPWTIRERALYRPDIAMLKQNVRSSN